MIKIIYESSIDLLKVIDGEWIKTETDKGKWLFELPIAIFFVPLSILIDTILAPIVLVRIMLKWATPSKDKKQPE